MSNLETIYLLPQKYQLHNFIVVVTFILSHTYTIIVVLICICSKLLQLCLTFKRYGLQPARLLCTWDSPGKNTGVDCHALFQGIFLIQGLNPCLLFLLRWQLDFFFFFFFTTSTTLKALVIMYIMITSYVYILQNDHRSKPSSHPSDSLAATKSLQSCPTLCNPIGDSPPGSPIPGSLQARTPEWVAISFCNAWK